MDTTQLRALIDAYDAAPDQASREEAGANLLAGSMDLTLGNIVLGNPITAAQVAALRELLIRVTSIGPIIFP